MENKNAVDVLCKVYDHLNNSDFSNVSELLDSIENAIDELGGKKQHLNRCLWNGLIDHIERVEGFDLNAEEVLEILKNQYSCPSEWGSEPKPIEEPRVYGVFGMGKFFGTDEEFIELAEKQGNVWSIKGFNYHWHTGEISRDIQLLIK